MKRIALLATVSALMAVCSTAGADVHRLTPPDPDLGDLDHGRYYTWGMETPWPAASQNAVSATLSFDNIRNWTWESNVLYIHLLDDAPLGIETGWDGQGGGDNFADEGIVLTIYRNLPAYPQDLSYEFTEDQVETLNAYAADGQFALGLDPDCHFYNCGVTLQIVSEVSEIPEPATAALVTLGLVGVIWKRRRRR